MTVEHGPLEDYKENTFRWAKRAAVLVVMLFLTALLLPTTKQAAAIWLVPKVVNNEQVQRIAGNTLDRLEELSAEPLRELLDQKAEEASE
jgi:hypothetical protein